MDLANQRLIACLSEQYKPGFSVAFFADPSAKTIYDKELSVRKAIPLPFPFSHAGGMQNLIRIRRILKEIEQENDMLIIQLPIIGFPALLSIRKPTVFHICANVLTAARNPIKYRGLNGMLARTFAYWLHLTNKRLFSRENVRVITNGSELASIYRLFSPVPVLSTSLDHEDIKLADEISKGSPKDDLKILFVGRPSLEKGFDVLITALRSIKRSFHVTVIGFGNDDFKRMLPAAYYESTKIHRRISFEGYLNWGDEFKRIIRGNDVMIMPSRSEGTPRVILEAMSQGVPVIASRVGGIPDIIQDGKSGLLFDVNDIGGLCSQIESLITTPGMRTAIVKEGLRLAEANTVDKFASHFIEKIEQLSNE